MGLFGNNDGGYNDGYKEPSMKPSLTDTMATGAKEKLSQIQGNIGAMYTDPNVKTSSCERCHGKFSGNEMGTTMRVDKNRTVTDRHVCRACHEKYKEAMIMFMDGVYLGKWSMNDYQRAIDYLLKTDDELRRGL